MILTRLFKGKLKFRFLKLSFDDLSYCWNIGKNSLEYALRVFSRPVSYFLEAVFLMTQMFKLYFRRWLLPLVTNVNILFGFKKDQRCRARMERKASTQTSTLSKFKTVVWDDSESVFLLDEIAMQMYLVTVWIAQNRSLPALR